LPLTDTRIRQLKSEPKAYKVADGGGLFLLVTASGDLPLAESPQDNWSLC
jgi:hypothetical protein